MEDKLDDRIYSRRVWVVPFLHPTYAPEDQREGELRRVRAYTSGVKGRVWIAFYCRNSD